MIHGMKTDNYNARQLLLAKMSKIERYDFFITGSRAYGNSTEDSDYDFFVSTSKYENSEFDLRHWLNGNDFNVLTYYAHYDIHEMKRNQQLIDIYRHPCGIDVQIVKDAVKKLEIQKFVFSFPQYKTLSKVQQRRMWIEAYRFFGWIEK